MKLYTEEQVLKAMNDYANTSSDLDYVMDVEMAIIEQLTPIELPSDDEIKSYSNRYSTIHEDVSDKLGKYLVSAIHIKTNKYMWSQMYKNGSKLPFWLLILVTILIGALLYFFK